MEIFETLEHREKEELLDIYWNIIDNVWDRRIGRKPIGFDLLPDVTKRFKKKSKYEILKPYIQKRMTEQEFEEQWKLLEVVH